MRSLSEAGPHSSWAVLGATVSSGIAFVPKAGNPTYGATKAAIHSYTQALRYQLQDTNVQVIELIPPFVQTELQGPAQATNPNAMPLQDYISETIHILSTTPDVTEVIVELVKPQRYAEAKGEYDAFFKQYNDAMTARAAQHAARRRRTNWRAQRLLLGGVRTPADGAARARRRAVGDHIQY